MSQYPDPYTPPYWPQGYGPTALTGARQAARRAGLLMMILGALPLSCGGFALMMARMPLDQMPPEQMQAMQDMAGKMGTTVAQFLTTSGVFMLVIGVVLIVLGLLARTGRRWAAILSLVAIGLGLLWMILNVLSALSVGGQQGMMGACLIVPVIALLGLAASWLAQSLRGPSPAEQAAQYQYWQYMQQMQAYYGGQMPPGAPPVQPGQMQPPFPPPPAPPAPPTRPEDRDGTSTLG